MEGKEQLILGEKESVYNIKHRAFCFAKEVVLFINKTQFEKIHFSLFDQLLRSATSIGANLVEGIAGASKNDFLKFYTIALKSANETKYWHCLIKETISSDKKLLDYFIKEADELSKIIASIIINSKKQSAPFYF